MDTRTLVIVVLMFELALAFALALCAVSATIFGLRLWGRLRRRVSVRIARCDGGYAATFVPPRHRSTQILDDSMMFLSETGNGGDGLLRPEDAAFTDPVTVRFVHHTPGEKMEFDRGSDRVRPLPPGQGGAAWMRYREQRPHARAATVLVLWRASARDRGKKPEVLRGARADQWIHHISTPDSSAPTSPAARIRTAITPAWFTDPENRHAVNVVGVVLGVVSAIVLVLVLLDIIGFRSAVPLTIDYDWLGFAGGLMGGVAGGVMTMAGVMLTLRNSGHAERRRQQDEGLRTRLSVMPLLDLKLSDDSMHFDNSHGQLAGVGWPVIPLGDRVERYLQNTVQHQVAFIAQNIGLGHARIRYMTVDRHGDSGAISRLGDFGPPDGMLQVGQEQVMRMALVQTMAAAAGRGKPDESFMLLLTVYYEDLLGNRYSQQLEASLFLPLPGPESSGVPTPTTNLFLRAIRPPEFVGVPDGNAYWFH